MNSFFRKLGWLARRRDRNAELREEIQFHLEEETEEEQGNGLAVDDARWAARREFGNVTRVEECTRAAWGWPRLEQVARDVGFGLRQIRRNPTFSAIAIATLALGIGGVTAIFSAVYTVLIRPLPYADADRLVMIWDNLDRKGTKSFPAPAEWVEWRHLNSVFSDMAATQPAEATLSGDSEPEQVPARKATGNLWDVLGVKPLIGRAFTEDEDVNGVQVAVISYGLWQRRYGGSPNVLGRTISVSDIPYEVVGVLPREFYFLPGRDIDLWMPASFPAWKRRAFSWNDEEVVARLKTGVTLEQARQAMTALSLQVTAKDFRGPHQTIVTPVREDIAGKTRMALVVLLCASAALLLIACVNMASLLTSRGLARSREVAMRVALGAGRGRLVVQFLTESLVLAGLGAIAGLALAMPAMRFLARLVPEAMGTVGLRFDWRVLAFSAAATIAAALTFGLLPALSGSKIAPQDGLRGVRCVPSSAHSYSFQHSLIVIETALAVVLLTCGGLFFEAFQHLRNTDLGMQSKKLLTFETPMFRFKDFARRDVFVGAVLDRIRAIPGVVSAGATSQLPLKANDANRTFYRLPGQSEDGVRGQVALIRVVTRDYFTTIDAHPREGRFFEDSDRHSDAQAAIVNESFANRNFPGRSAIGMQFKFRNLGDKGYSYRIVGVMKEIREVAMDEELPPAVYTLHEQGNDQLMVPPSNIVIRTAVEPASIVPEIRRAVWSVDKNQPIWHVQTLDEIMDQQLTTPKQSTVLLGAFALLALLLASLGIYGVLSYAVAQRTAEIGVRMALGATHHDILLTFGKRGLVLTLIGLAIGLGLATFASRFLSALLYGFRPDYLETVIGVSIMLLSVAALACFVPARRASRVSPVVALRSE